MLNTTGFKNKNVLLFTKEQKGARQNYNLKNQYGAAKTIKDHNTKRVTRAIVIAIVSYSL